jgi:hypothetical protein
MKIDRNTLKKLIEQSKPNETLVLTVNSLEKNSLQSCQKEIGKFVNKEDDYVIVMMKR